MPKGKKMATLHMPILALRGLMVFPHMVLHFDVGRDKSVAALEQAMMDNQEIFLVAQRDAEAVDPTEAQLCQVGSIPLRSIKNTTCHLTGGIFFLWNRKFR